MQPVLALAPLLAPMPETAAEIPPAPEGAFLTALEAEATVPDPVAGSLVAVVVPGVPARVAPEVAVPEASARGPEEPAQRPAGDGTKSMAKFTGGEVDAARQTPDRPDADPKAELLALSPHGTGQAVTARPATGTAAPMVEAPRHEVDGAAVAPAVRKAVVESEAGPSPGRGEDLFPVRDGVPGAEARLAVRVPDRALVGTLMTPTHAGLEAPPAGRHQMDRPREMTHGALVPSAGGETPAVSSAPQALATVGEVGMPQDAPARTIPLVTEVAADHRPTADHRVGEAPVRRGVWESVFSSLSLLPLAPPRVTSGLGHVLPVSADPLLVDARGLVESPLLDVIPMGEPEELPAGSAATKPLPASTIAQPASVPTALAHGSVEAARPISLPVEGEADEAATALLPPVHLATGAAASGAGHGPAGAVVAPPSPVPQTAVQIAAALPRSGDGATELALSPEELGHVRLRLEPDVANPERMVVMITFERPETLDLFRRHATELAEALRAAGYAGADIGFGQDQSGSTGGDASGAGSRSGSVARDPQEAALSPSPPSPRQLAAGTSLDLRL